MKNIVYECFLVWILSFGISIFTGCEAQGQEHSNKMRAYQATRLAVAAMNNPDTAPDEADEELCDGSGWITQGDGHRTECPGCSACKKKDGQVAADMEPEYNVYHFGAEWCSPCVKMKKETWPDPKMVKFLKDKKVKLFMFDADNEEHKKYFDHYKVNRFPTVILLDRDDLNKPLKKTVGGMDAKTMIQQMDEAI